MISTENKKVKFLVDGHVHIYPFYDLQHVLQRGISNLQLASKKISASDFKRKESNSKYDFMIWFLTEQSDCHFFEEIITSAKTNGNKKYKFLPTDERESIYVEKEGKSVLFIFAGRQIVAKEGVEILSLASRLSLEDNKNTATDIIEAVVDSNGIAALNWAPGKWFFRRGKVVRLLLESQSPESLLICDTSLRTRIWPKPKLMAMAENQGFKVIAGSDPLPFSGEENFVGSYGFFLNGEFKPEKPADSVRSLLRRPDTKLTLIGRRNNIINFCQRQYKILLEQRRQKISTAL